MPEDALTEAERTRLAPYVTDLDGPVFVLTDLPEVVKGALFSRYSRSTLGLRRLLLKEFLQEQPPGGATPQRAAAGLSVDRAQDFYDRILDGFGDDSIGELGGAHVAIENVSMIATKILEDARIGGSPLEKSTRYVSFAERQGGDYLFYKEPRLMESTHAERYAETCRALFAGYAEMIEPVCRYIESVFPREPDTREGAYRRSVRAKAFDALRGLLPASTVTNMGIFGNGRFFESLLIRLSLCGLAEGERLAEAMRRELGKVVPSFIRRADPAHPHFDGFRKFERELARTVDALGERHGPAVLPAGGEPPVRLVEYDPDAEAKVLAGLLFPVTGAPLGELRAAAEEIGAEARERIFAELAALRTNRRHKLPRALETVAYAFDLVGDFGMYRDLHRHRMMTQVRQPLSTRLGFEMPEEVSEAGLAPRYEALMVQAAEAYEAIAPEFPAEAQYLVPMAYRIRWYVQINLRALMWMVELRSSPQGHPAYRRMVQAMYREVEAVHPNLARLIRFVDLQDYPLGRLGAEQRQEDKRRGADG
ncbi:MAG: FAD-dependent thymidylate synthase [SAR324 cluster bacterium]|nr:FAD-dependent thymidylate synthase [SAR324 cluster bacterium]